MMAACPTGVPSFQLLTAAVSAHKVHHLQGILFPPRLFFAQARLFFAQAKLVFAQDDNMKIVNSLKSMKARHKDCRIIRRKGRVYVINKTNPRFKARQG